MINKIKLVKAPQVELRWWSIGTGSLYFPPLALANITAYLRQQGFKVDQDDLNQKAHYSKAYFKTRINLNLLNNHQRIIHFLEGKEDKKIRKLLDSIIKLSSFEDFDIYLISLGRAYTLNVTMSTLLLCKHIKEVYKKPIVVGGDLWPELLNLNSKFNLFDYAIQGPGEIAVYKLIKALNQNLPINSIKGLTYWNNKKLIKNKGQYPPILIKPDFKGLPLNTYAWYPPSWMSKYIKNYDRKQKILILPIKFTDGCPNNCAFCGLYYNRLHVLKPSKVVQTLKELKEEYNTSHFIFFSNTLNISKKYINDLCDEILKNKLKIYWTDSLIFNNLDKPALIKMRNAGCIQAVFGLETASPRLLKYIEKRIKIKQCSHILKEADSAGIWNSVNIVAGFPTEAEEDIEQTLSFLKNNKKYFNTLYVAPFNLRKSKMLLYPKDYGLKHIRNIYTASKINNAASHNCAYNEEHGLKLREKEEMPVFYLGASDRHYAYDEENDLNWREKIKQTLYSTKKIRFEAPHVSDNFLEELPLLYYLYSNVPNKELIKEIRRDIIQKFYRLYVCEHPLMSMKMLFKSTKNINQIVNKIKKII